MNIAYLKNCSIHITEKCVMISGSLRVEMYSQTRSVLFMHIFRVKESQVCEKVLGFFGYTSASEVDPDAEKELYLLKLYFDDEGFITDAESFTEGQARKIRLDIVRAMPDPEPPH